MGWGSGHWEENTLSLPGVSCENSAQMHSGTCKTEAPDVTISYFSGHCGKIPSTRNLRQ